MAPLPRLVDRARTLRRWAGTSRTDPLSAWGHRRGTAVDRWYIERFLTAQADAVHGDVLEVKEDLYASALGAASVQVLDIDPANPAATLVGDLVDPATLPQAAFDAAVVTQTLQYVTDPVAALANLLGSLRPAGTLLLTVPATSRLSGEADRWRWTALGLRQHLTDAANRVEGAEVALVAAPGNSLTCRAFLMGLATEDLGPRALSTDDDQYPLVVTAVARRG